MENEIIAQRIKALRHSENLTLEEFAHIAGLKEKSSVSKWENGKVGSLKSTVIKNIADHFHINPMWLIYEDARKEAYTKDEQEALFRIEKKIEDELDPKDLTALELFVDALTRNKKRDPGNQ